MNSRQAEPLADHEFGRIVEPNADIKEWNRAAIEDIEQEMTEEEGDGKEGVGVLMPIQPFRKDEQPTKYPSVLTEWSTPCRPINLSTSGRTANPVICRDRLGW